jgi:hypothetical protein
MRLGGLAVPDKPLVEQIAEERLRRRDEERRRAAEAEPTRRGKAGRLRRGRESPHPPLVEAFLALNAEETFDIERLNQLDLDPLLASPGGKRASLSVLGAHAERLILRVSEETRSPALASALLRTRIAEWFRRSPGDAGWSTATAARWAGLFEETRVAGGMRRRPLQERLEQFAEACGNPPRPKRAAKAVKRGKGAGSPEENEFLVGPLREVAQAVLDGLVVARRDPAKALPLVRLGEVGQRRGLIETNEVLGRLFPNDGTGNYVVLTYERYPDCGIVTIRPPRGARARTDPMFMIHAEGAEPPSAVSEGSPNLGAGAASGDVWARPGLDKAAWAALLPELQRAKMRLEAPPWKAYRAEEPYQALRELILDDAGSRRLFIAVRWKGRPESLAVLAQLLDEGAFDPEGGTAGQYLEAELGHLVKGDPDFQPRDGTWRLDRRWLVSRKGDYASGLAYAAVRGDA